MARKEKQNDPADSQMTIEQSTDQTGVPSGQSGLAAGQRLEAHLDVTSGSSKADRQEFFLPVSGFVWLFPEEVDVVDHPAFQRLGRIYQLGQAYLVYRGATHKRLEHVLGALRIVQRMMDAVARNSEKSDDGIDRAPTLSKEEERFVRLGTLLHDIGHVAAGHTVEDELNLIPKHDGDERLDQILNGKEWLDDEGRSLGAVIDAKFRVYVPKDLAKKGVSPSTLVRLLIRKAPDPKTDPHRAAVDLLESSSTIRLEVCRDMIGDTICADLLDYIHRDWYHIGKPRPFDDRLLQYMEIHRGVPGRRNGQRDANDKFVISLGKRPKIRTDAISNILELLEWRYQLAEAVLFHRTKLAATAMLDRALFELWGRTKDKSKIVSFLLGLSDEEMLSQCRKEAEALEANAGQNGDALESARMVSKLMLALERRQLFSHLSTRFYSDLPGDVVVRAQKLYGKDPDDPTAPPINRNTVLKTLEADFALPPGSLAMYCPAGVNQKIAQVKIAVSGEIKTFSVYEEEHHEQLAGGHLAAQLRRFARLWRVHFFIDREVRDKLGDSVYLLQQAIEKLVLGNLVDEEDYERVSLSIAKTLVQVEGCFWKGRQVSSSIDAARDSTVSSTYPLGGPSIRTFIVPE